MHPSQPSRTAEYMAFFRACESVRPPSKRLFVDPLAAHFVNPSLRDAVRLAGIPVLGALVSWYVDRRAGGARTSAIARTRLIDDLACQALRDGMRQVVILGAGFDCRAYRLPGIDSAAVFEVDHPATLELKLARLRGVLPELPPHVHFVQVDFNRESFPQRLAEGGFDLSSTTLFLWEGVTHYLSSDAVDSVLRYVSVCPPGSRLIFSYVHSGALDPSASFEGAADILRNVARLGEPWTFGLDPVTVPEYLRQRGLQLDRDASARDYRTQYYGAAGQRMRGYDFYHVAIAHVPTKEKKTVAAE